MPNFDLPFSLTMNTSSSGVGAVLQEMHGFNVPIDFAL